MKSTKGSTGRAAFLRASFNWQTKAFIGKRARYPLTILFTHAFATSDLVPSSLHLSFHLIDDVNRPVPRKQKALALREQILRVGISTSIPADHGKVAPLEADRGCGREIVCR